MIKRFHESPKSIHDIVHRVTDGDFVLTHLLEKDPEYAQQFMGIRDKMLILDNSVNELKTPVAFDILAKWINILKPDVFVLPDVLDNYKSTLNNACAFLHVYPNLPGKRMGVVQGNSLEECIQCYIDIEPLVDMVGFSYTHPWYGLDLRDKMLGRINMLRELESKGHINKFKPHHLLGVSLPQELIYYGNMQRFTNDWQWVASVDTSNPVAFGIRGEEYNSWGMGGKPGISIDDIIDMDVPNAMINIILNNIRHFNGYCEGEYYGKQFS